GDAHVPLAVKGRASSGGRCSDRRSHNNRDRSGNNDPGEICHGESSSRIGREGLSHPSGGRDVMAVTLQFQGVTWNTMIGTQAIEAQMNKASRESGALSHSEYPCG